MAKDSAKPNRKLVNYYREKTLDLGYSTRIFATHIVGEDRELVPHKERIEADVDYSGATVSLINEIRPRLNNEFKDLSNEELIVDGIFLVARKTE